MSAVWIRAHELGQPLTLIVIGSVNPGRRRSSSAIRSDARCLVSTIASLQNSMPVHAMVCLRNALGVTGRSARASSAASSAVRASGTSSITIFCSVVVRPRPLPYSVASLATSASESADIRPTRGAKPT